jgi:hypothetical protein
MRIGYQLIGDLGNLRAILTVQQSSTRVVLYKLPQQLVLYESHMPLAENFDHAKVRALTFFMSELKSENRDEIKNRIQWSPVSAAVPRSRNIAPGTVLHWKRLVAQLQGLAFRS